MRRLSLLTACLLGVLAGTGCRSDPEGAALPSPDGDTTRGGRPDLPPDAVSAPLYEATELVTAADFALPTLAGDTFRLSEQRGKVVVLNLWATWCGPCRYEIPDFIALQQELGPQGLLFVGVSLDEEGEAVVRPFAAEYAFNYPVLLDDGTVAETYGPVTVMPTTYIIDRQGKLRRYAPGMLLKEALRPVLMELLEEGVTG
jgi:cytochrome c biogenesis protein CcmG/thiol:disulfide interchange protein DsbE